MAWLMGYARRSLPGQTCHMAKHTPTRRQSKPTRPRAKLPTDKQQKVAQLIAAALQSAEGIHPAGEEGCLLGGRLGWLRRVGE